MNVYDSRIIASILTRDGYKETDTPENADIIMVNTCSVREHAEQRAIGRITSLHALRKDKPELLIGVVGCMAQNLKEQIPEADFVVGPSNYRELPGILGAMKKQHRSDRFARSITLFGVNAEAPTRGRGEIVYLYIGRALSPAAGLRVPPISHESLLNEVVFCDLCDSWFQ
jgi:tRNA A37 methylthiotransferase MiaB